MILLIQNIEDYNNDLRVSLQAFYGGERIVVPEIFDKKPELKAEIDKELVADIDDNRINIELYSVVDGGERTLACSTQIPVDGDCRDKSAVRNPLKLAIYNMLSEYTDRRLPWGSLTGIRSYEDSCVLYGSRDDLRGYNRKLPGDIWNLP